MKLCRFELKAKPGEIRAGMVHGGKIYETDGANPIGTHEADEVRPLAPVGLPATVRFFDPSDLTVEALIGEEAPLPLYSYGNPTSVIGPSMIVPFPTGVDELEYRAYLGVVIAGAGTEVALEAADDLVLGYTLCLALSAPAIAAQERKAGFGPGRSRDIAIAIGPVLTTPDELDEVVVDESRGRRFRLGASLKINGEDAAIGQTEDLPATPAEAIAAASLSATVAPGDLILIGPLVQPLKSAALTKGDEMKLSVERLGALSLRIAL